MMNIKSICMLLPVVAISLLLSACGPREEEQEPAGTSPETTIKPMQEYRKQAQEQITAENAEDELKRLQDEIEAENE